jgi:hypothetical protein
MQKCILRQFLVFVRLVDIILEDHRSQCLGHIAPRKTRIRKGGIKHSLLAHRESNLFIKPPKEKDTKATGYHSI